MKSVNSIILFFIFLFTSCVTTEKPLPDWLEVKPENSRKVIYFTYGPADNREEAKKGLYKEISEYFGVKVSSVDKFVKNITFDNGERNINQEKESNVDITSREKGLSAIEIREVWNDNGKRWCMLAALDTQSAEKIKKQVEEDIEQERLSNLVLQGEDYIKQLEVLLADYDKDLLELSRVKIKIKHNVDKSSELSDPTELLKLSNSSQELINSYTEKANEISSTFSSIKITNTKLKLLLDETNNDEITVIKIEALIDSGKKILDYTETMNNEIDNFNNQIKEYKIAVNKNIGLAEVDIVAGKDSIKTNYLEIIKIKDKLREIEDSSTYILKELKDRIYDKSVKYEDKKNITYENVNFLAKNYSSALELKEQGQQLLSDIKVALQSITDSEESRDQYYNAEAEMSWVDIYLNNILSIKLSGEKLKESFLVEGMLNDKLSGFIESVNSDKNYSGSLTIGDFTIKDSSISSEFSLYLQALLSGIISKYNSLEEINYWAVTGFYTDKNINPDALYNDVEIKDLVVDSILYGEYLETNSKGIELKVVLKDIKSNIVIHSALFSIPYKALPQVNLKPDNFNTVSELDSAISKGDSLDTIDIWPDKGNGGVYEDGENMIINLLAQKDGFIKIYHLSADNELSLIFPNKFDKDNSIKSGVKYTIGDSLYPFRFNLGKPYGIESIKVIFSDSQFNDLENVNYVNDFLLTGVRGVNIYNRINSDINSDNVIKSAYYTIIK